jgi:hypothetical protein
MARDETHARNPITVARFMKHVASSVDKFFRCISFIVNSSSTCALGTLPMESLGSLAYIFVFVYFPFLSYPLAANVEPVYCTEYPKLKPYTLHNKDISTIVDG